MFAGTYLTNYLTNTWQPRPTCNAGSPNLNGRDFGMDLVVDENGNVVVTGFFEGTARFEDSPVVSHGGQDIFIAHTTGNSNGCCKPVATAGNGTPTARTIFLSIQAVSW